jgi:hypothetical protein
MAHVCEEALQATPAVRSLTLTQPGTSPLCTCISQAEQLDCPIQRISLRDDPKLPAATSLGVAPPGAKATSVSRLVETAREEQASLKAREVLSQMHAQLLAAQRWSPIELMALAAPDPFFFKVRAALPWRRMHTLSRRPVCDLRVG